MSGKPSNKPKQAPSVTTPNVVKIVEDSLKGTIQSKMTQAALTKSAPAQFQVDASLKGVAASTVKSALVNEAFRQICSQGHLVTLTCESNAPGKASYFFDFSTERGKERVAVGISMDTDRATYIGKKVMSLLGK